MDITALLESASSLFTWFITQMGALVTFISSNPVLLVMVLIMLCGAVVGMFSRIFHSV